MILTGMDVIHQQQTNSTKPFQPVTQTALLEQLGMTETGANSVSSPESPESSSDESIGNTQIYMGRDETTKTPHKKTHGTQPSTYTTPKPMDYTLATEGMEGPATRRRKKFMKVGWKPPQPSPKPKHKRTPVSIERAEQRKKQKPAPVEYDPKVHTTEQQHLWKNFWDIDETVLQSFETIIDNRQQNEGIFRTYIKKQFKQIIKMMRENGKLGPSESYTPTTFEEWRKNKRILCNFRRNNLYHPGES